VYSPSIASLATVDCVTCAICVAFQLVLLKVLLDKGLRAQFPVFFAYNAAYAATTVVLLWAGVSAGPAAPAYFYLYWILNSVLIFLEFGVMYEVFVHAVKPYSGLVDLAKLLFGWAALFLLLAASLTAFSTAGPHLAKCVAATAYLDRGLRMMQCGLLILFFLFERRLGLSWRSHSVCAALGLGTVAASGLSITFLRTQHAAWALPLDLASNAIYLATVITWVVCFRLPQPERKTVLDSPARLIFQRWNDALSATPFVSHGGAAVAQMDSFLPNVERTVERVMSRKMVN
jgi:hypothetical protein